jgi:small redox-active disulfide protein 2
MKIEILGTGCSRCKTLEKNLKKAVEELNIQADILKVSDIQKMIEYGIMAAPALVIDGEVKCSGSLPDVEKIKEWLR